MASTAATAMVSMQQTMNSEGDPNSKSWFKRQSFITQATYVVVLVTIGLNVAALAMFSTAVVGVAAAAAVVTSVVVSFFQCQIEDEDSLRSIQNALRGDVNKFGEENNKLTSNIDDLEGQVDRLKEQKNQFESICEQQGGDATKFLELLKENADIIEQQKTAVTAETSQIVTRAVLNADNDNSGSISTNEVFPLTAQLRFTKGLKINNDILMKKVEQDGRLSAIIELVKQMTDDKIPDEEKAFYFDKDGFNS